MHSLGLGHEYIDGQFVSTEISQIVQAIKEYEPNIDVKWIPPTARKDGQAAYKIVFDAPGEEPYVIMHIQHDYEFTPAVLKQIIQGDQRRNKLQLSDLEASETAAKLLARQKWLDYLEEQQDIVEHVIKTKLNTYKVNDELIIKDGIPFSAHRLKD